MIYKNILIGKSNNTSQKKKQILNEILTSNIPYSNDKGKNNTVMTNYCKNFKMTDIMIYSNTSTEFSQETERFKKIIHKKWWPASLIKPPLDSCILGLNLKKADMQVENMIALNL